MESERVLKEERERERKRVTFSHSVKTSSSRTPTRSLSSFSSAPTINLNNVLPFLLCFQAIRHQVRRLPAGDKSAGPREEGEGQGFPPELFHLPGVSEADEHRRGALRPGRQQVCLQAGLHVGQDAAGHASHARSSR